MLAYPYDNLVAGIFLVLAGLFALIRQSLLEPESAKYPRAPTWLRNSMFAFAAILMFCGLQNIGVFVTKKISENHEASATVVTLAVVLCFYNAAMLCNLLRQRYPEETWDRLNRINDRLFCNQKPIHRWINK